MQSALLAHYILKGANIKGALLDRRVGAHADLLGLITAKSPSTGPVCDTATEKDGLVESLWFQYFMMTTVNAGLRNTASSNC